MGDSITMQQGDRIIELLEIVAGVTSSSTAIDISRPRHSGHKGGDFLKEIKRDFSSRFPDSEEQWKTMNSWITTVFNIAGRFKKALPDATAEDLEWLYSILIVSLGNGFAKAIADLEA